MPGYINIKTRCSLFDHLLDGHVRIWDRLPKLCDPHLGGYIINIRKYVLDDPAEQPDDAWRFDYYEIFVRYDQVNLRTEPTRDLIAVPRNEEAMAWTLT